MAQIRKDRYDEEYYADIIERTRVLLPAYQRKLQQWFDIVGYRLKPGALVLDAGCGVATLAKFLLMHHQGIVGIDICEYALDQARKLVPEAYFCSADLNQPLPFKDKSFDLVVSYEVIEHLRFPKIFVREAWRVLRPGGHLVIKTPNAWDLWRVLDPLQGRQWYADVDKTHVGYLSPLGMWRLLRDTGFMEVRVRCGTRPRSFYWLNLRLPLFGHGIAAIGLKP